MWKFYNFVSSDKLKLWVFEMIAKHMLLGMLQKFKAEHNDNFFHIVEEFDIIFRNLGLHKKEHSDAIIKVKTDRQD